MRRILKIGAWILAMALLSVVASLQTIVSSEPFKRHLIAVLGHDLPGAITIDALTLDYVTGLQARQIAWRLEERTLFQLQGINLAIDWPDLLLGRLTIREVRIHGGRLDLSAAHLTGEPESPSEESTPPTPHPVLAPAWVATTLPLRLAMQSFVVEDIDLAYEPMPGARLSVRQLAMRAALRVDRQGMDLTGKITIDDLAYADGNGSVHLPVSLEMDLGNESGQGARRSTLRLGKLLTVPLDARLTLNRHPAEIDLLLRAEPVELAPLLALVKPWLPDDWRAARLTGKGGGAWRFQGVRDDDGLSGSGEGALELTDLDARLPGDRERVLERGTARLTISGMRIQAGAWQGMRSELHGTAERLVIPEVQVGKGSLLMGAEHRADGSLAGHGRLKVERLLVGGEGEGGRPVHFETKLLAAFDPERERFSIDRLLVRLDDIARIGGRLELTPDDQTDGEQSLSGTFSATVDGRKLAVALARLLPGGVTLSVSPGESRLSLHGRATLMANRLPRRIALGGLVDLAPVAWSDDETGVGGRLERLKLAWKAHRPVVDGPIEGVVKGTLSLAEPRAGADLTSEEAEITLAGRGRLLPESGAWEGRARFDGHLEKPVFAADIRMDRFTGVLETEARGTFTPDAPFGDAVVSQSWSGVGRKASVRDGDYQWLWPDFHWSARASSELNSGLHRLDSLAIDAEGALTARLSGEYRSEEDFLRLTGGLERLELGRLALLASDEGGAGATHQPFSGNVAVKVDLEGSPGSLKGWSREAPPPLRLALTASASGVEGRWGNARLTGGKGNVNLRFAPEPGQGVTLRADLHAGRWERPEAPAHVQNGGKPPAPLDPGAPWREFHGIALEQARLEFELVGRDPDHWRLNRLKGGLPGLEAELHGEVSGLSGLLDPREMRLPERLAGLFVDLTGRARADLERANPVLATLETRGTGRGELEWSLFKAVNGPFITRFLVSPRELGVTRGDLVLSGMTGTLIANKSTWTDPKQVPVKTKARRAFALERIASPLTSGIEGRRLNIERLELAGVRAEKITMELSYQEGQLRGQNLRLDLLGGTIAGNVLLEGSKPARMDALLEGVEVDLNRLLPAEAGIVGDGQVDFIARLALRFDKESGRLDLGRSEAGILFTRIGKEALDRLLRFLDPKESNPALSNARSKVSYANPSQMNLQLAKGTIKLKIDFREGMVSSLNLERIPLGVLGQFEQIQQDLAPVENLARLLEWIGMTHLEVETREATAP
ncbi:hypothetical protein SIID45300_03085 [Candidatus Magnetaquicoccaceae bacterium FCR-1]|uniref:AsmA family protein n=1 Tax=Candidatus Magnetaquiglobus chichijimensis TaxID=3141448 RepID=A0ABQ0CDG2_9PROT